MTKVGGFTGSSIPNLVSFTKLSSGLRISKAADDPAGLSIASKLSASIASLSEASKNISYAVSRFEVADSALSQASSLTGELQALATQAANGTLNDEQRGAIQAQYNQLVEEIQRIGATTEFNGAPVLDGSPLVVQVGTDSASSSRVTAEGVNLAQIASSLTSQSLTSQASARSAIDAIREVSTGLTSARGEIGAATSRIEKASALNDVMRQNYAAARAQITDLNVAEEMSKLTAQAILQNQTAALNAQAARLETSTVFNLLGGSGSKK
jgi:flagellin